MDRQWAGRARDTLRDITERIVEQGGRAAEAIGDRWSERNGRRTSREGERVGARTDAQGTRARTSSATGESAARGLAARSKRELYELARERDIPGRSAMSKDELIRALRR